jgi:heme exporter protein D
MQWSSLSDFLAMGGYGFYVWVSFGATAVGMIGEVVLLRYRHAAALEHQGAVGESMPS